MELEVKLQVFEGPLDLLLHLIEKNKVVYMTFQLLKLRNSNLIM